MTNCKLLLQNYIPLVVFQESDARMANSQNIKDSTEPTQMTVSHVQDIIQPCFGLFIPENIRTALICLRHKTDLSSAANVFATHTVKVCPYVVCTGAQFYVSVVQSQLQKSSVYIYYPACLSSVCPFETTTTNSRKIKTV